MACQIKITNLRMCDVHGNPAAWSYSAPSYGVRVDWSVVGSPSAPYQVKFAMGDAVPIVFSGYSGAGTYWSFCELSYPTLFTVPVTVTIDPGKVSGNTTPTLSTKTLDFAASPPATAVTYYAPATLYGSQTMTVPVRSGVVGKLVMLLGKPTTDTFQKVLSGACPGGKLVTTQPTGYPVYEEALLNKGTGAYSFSQTFEVVSSNVACNLSLIRSTWAQMDSLKTSMKSYLAAEGPVETSDPAIVAFTKASLPSNYRTTMTPLQTAERLFQAVVRAITYRTPYTVDASTVFKTKLGDCGGMTNLYNACLRLVGIPCRMVDGWWTDKVTHCWTEIYFYGAGWIPADASLSRKFSPACNTLSFFGYSPDSNQRCAVCRTETLDAADFSASFLQIGDFFYWYSGTPPMVGAMTTSLSLSTSPSP